MHGTQQDREKAPTGVLRNYALSTLSQSAHSLSGGQLTWGKGAGGILQLSGPDMQAAMYACMACCCCCSCFLIPVSRIHLSDRYGCCNWPFVDVKSEAGGRSCLLALLAQGVPGIAEHKNMQSQLSYPPSVSLPSHRFTSIAVSLR